MTATEPPRRLDENVERIHEALVDLLEGGQPEVEAEPEYWQLRAPDVEVGFAALVDEWRDLDPEFPAPGPSTQGSATSGTKKSPTSAG
jgi:hypothetical protein